MSLNVIKKRQFYFLGACLMALITTSPSQSKDEFCEGLTKVVKGVSVPKAEKNFQGRFLAENVKRKNFGLLEDSVDSSKPNVRAMRDYDAKHLLGLSSWKSRRCAAIDFILKGDAQVRDTGDKITEGIPNVMIKKVDRPVTVEMVRGKAGRSLNNLLVQSEDHQYKKRTSPEELSLLMRALVRGALTIEDSLNKASGLKRAELKAAVSFENLCPYFKGNRTHSTPELESDAEVKAAITLYVWNRFALKVSSVEEAQEKLFSKGVLTRTPTEWLGQLLTGAERLLADSSAKYFDYYNGTHPFGVHKRSDTVTVDLLKEKTQLVEKKEEKKTMLTMQKYEVRGRINKLPLPGYGGTFTVVSGKNSYGIISVYCESVPDFVKAGVEYPLEIIGGKTGPKGKKKYRALPKNPETLK